MGTPDSKRAKSTVDRTQTFIRRLNHFCHPGASWTTPSRILTRFQLSVQLVHPCSENICPSRWWSPSRSFCFSWDPFQSSSCPSIIFPSHYMTGPSVLSFRYVFRRIVKTGYPSQIGTAKSGLQLCAPVVPQKTSLKRSVRGAK